MKYNHQKIEKKWQKAWEKSGIYNALDKSEKPKWYSLIEFPYPSGAGLHVGHPRPYIAMDIISRKRRMQGHNVLFPIGWDAFGLPTENYAIKTGIAPDVATKQNVATFKKQLKLLGFSFDWNREINTTDPKYYKWTQWMFLQFFKHGLAYKAKAEINWCPKDKIGLANEEVENGRCERCGGPVEKREKEQWMLKMSSYSEKLLSGLKGLDFIPEVTTSQENWIGKSEGAEIEFQIVGSKNKIKVFTTRPDTIFGATYLVVAPEHPSLAFALTNPDSLLKNKEEVRQYLEVTKKKSDIERASDSKEKTGVELKGLRVINPATKEEIPVWSSDYVLAGYGTGAIMAVPAHDDRDWDFAKKFNLPIKFVIEPPAVLPGKDNRAQAYSGVGHLQESGDFSGQPSWEVLPKMAIEFGQPKITYKLRDWVFSRQRYWGEPIPLINCVKCGWVAVPAEKLPVKLPKVEKYQPTDNGESPLSKIDSWVNVKCPNCKGPAKRETDTMPNWAGSSWYFLRYLDPKNDKTFAEKEKMKHWLPVDWYNGGMEHATRHLLYARFWNQFLHDIGEVPVSEPFKKRTAHGTILASDGKKMSKSVGNVVNPDDLVKEFGADALRLYEMFIGPFDQMVTWDPRGILGTSRFLQKVWRIATMGPLEKSSLETERLLHKTIKKVSEDIEKMSFNTAVSAMMVFANAAEGSIAKGDFEHFVKILAPFAPFMAEELWAMLGHAESVHLAPWPEVDLGMLEQETFDLIIQVNGRVRGKISASRNISQAEAQALALADGAVKKWVSAAPQKVIFVPNRLINFIV